MQLHILHEKISTWSLLYIASFVEWFDVYDHDVDCLLFLIYPIKKGF